jgi:DNA-binding transcriptional ArsR family regulator
MAFSKATLFSEDEIGLANIAKAISHPARLKILKILMDKNTCMCGDIVEILPLAQSTVSQHLKELKRADLIMGEIEGPKICYCINKKKIEHVKKNFNDLFSTICNC